MSGHQTDRHLCCADPRKETSLRCLCRSSGKVRPLAPAFQSGCGQGRCFRDKRSPRPACLDASSTAGDLPGEPQILGDTLRQAVSKQSLCYFFPLYSILSSFLLSFTDPSDHQLSLWFPVRIALQEQKRNLGALIETLDEIKNFKPQIFEKKNRCPVC